MSITYSIDHVATSVEDVSVEVAAKSEMTSSSTVTDPKTGRTTTVYTLASGDNAFPATVSYSSVLQQRASGPVREVSMLFSTWAVADNSVSGVATRKPLSGKITFVIPADYTVELADMDDFIGNLFSFLYASVSTKVRDTAWLKNLLFGIPKAS
jgi:hypothetical protein